MFDAVREKSFRSYTMAKNDGSKMTVTSSPLPPQAEYKVPKTFQVGKAEYRAV